MTATSRYDQLDALRGLAAFGVVISHFSLLTPLEWVKHTPLSLISSGHESVILFFVLSGFVLSIQLTSAAGISYPLYAAKRICRIYVPYLAAVLIGYLAFRLTFRGTVSWAGVWANSPWPGNLSIADVLAHVIMLAPFQSDRIVPVVWSLVYEVRISLVLPLLVLAITRWKSSVLLVAAWCVSAGVALSFLYSNPGQNALLTDSNAGGLIETAHYALMFVVGGVLAKHRNELIKIMSTGVRNMMGIAAGLIFLGLGRYCHHRFMTAGGEFLFDWFVTLGSACLITSAISSTRFASLLTIGPLKFLGRISFSLYLFHTIVLLTILHLVGDRITPAMTVGLAFACVWPVCIAAFYLIESPSMRLSSRLNRLNQKDVLAHASQASATGSAGAGATS